MAKQLKQYISFKKNEEHLYDFIESKRDKSCFIKDLIEKAYLESKEANTIPAIKKVDLEKEELEIEW